MTNPKHINFLSRYKIEIGVGGVCLLIGWAAAFYYNNQKDNQKIVHAVIDQVIQQQEERAEEVDAIEKELAVRIESTNQKIDQHQKEVGNAIKKMQGEMRQRNKEFHEDFDRTFDRLVKDANGQTVSKKQSPDQKEKQSMLSIKPEGKGQ